MKNKTDFITHFCLKNRQKNVSGCLKAFFIALFLLLSLPSVADSIAISRNQAKILQNGQLSVSSRFQITLPEQLQDALKQGVPLDFALSYRLEKPTLAAYRMKLAQLVSSDNEVNYRLTYHPLTGRYRVAVGTFSTEYNSLENALKAVGAIVNWVVLPHGALDGESASDVKAQIRLNLTTTRLPKPFQINALTSHNWYLDSGWLNMNIQ